ncbi:MAG: ABC transporter ATP-binding protein [Rhodospirillales bacterium]|nr:ABC transporter ATP-binding protein [Rhodospirillales bacterium]
MTDTLPLTVEGLAAGYGKREVFSDLSIEVRPGEILGLIGLNGVGKTTLIKSILGLGDSRRGHIRIFGIDNGQTASRARLAYLPEKFQSSPLLKGWEFLSLSLAYYRLPLHRERALTLAHGLDFPVEALDRMGRTYSKGMGQKLGLIATLLTGLPLLILDEPMSGLDPRARIMLKDRLLEYRQAGNTVFFSSHILADIEEICDRIAVLHHGRLIYVGEPRPFVEHYQAPGLERAFLAAITEAEGVG